MSGYSEGLEELFSTQLNDWELARINYSLLDKVHTREIDFGRFRILVQFNPERMKSTAAKVDPKSIGDRPCFLCGKNRPEEQKGLTFENDLTLLVNPFPIFKKHLTIPSYRHVDQRILSNFPLMLKLAEALPDYVIFYNGPQCGASAPDHFHFQAGNRGFLPIETDFLNGKFAKLSSVKSGVEILNWSGYLRGIITLKSPDADNLRSIFNQIFEKLSEIQSDRPEPMINILAYVYDNTWIIHLIPRKIHRPTQFFKEGNDQILLSPASVDLGGVLITPREVDFNKINAVDIKDIFGQVCFDENELVRLFN